MSHLLKVLEVQTEKCKECRKEIHIWFTESTEPEGVRVNGEPYCWDCLEKLQERLSAGLR